MSPLCKLDLYSSYKVCYNTVVSPENMQSEKDLPEFFSK